MQCPETCYVLPAIRKDGMYVKGGETVVAGRMSDEKLELFVFEQLESSVERIAEIIARLTGYQ